MSRGKFPVFVRPFLYIASAVGLVRAVDDVSVEARSPKDFIHSKVWAEGDDVNTKAIWIVGICLLLTIWAVVLLIYPLLQFYKYDRTGGRQPSKVLADIPPQPPRPRNVIHPFKVLKDFRDAEDGQLNHYNWVDRSKGIVSIPVGRAMQIIAEKGIPPSKPPQGNEYYTPRAGSLLTGFEGKVDQQPQ